MDAGARSSFIQYLALPNASAPLPPCAPVLPLRPALAGQARPSCLGPLALAFVCVGVLADGPRDGHGLCVFVEWLGGRKRRGAFSIDGYVSFAVPSLAPS
jgi:hypothetical protein